MVETASRKPCRIAEQEIHADKVKWLIPEKQKTAAEAANELLDQALGKQDS
jgi:hypothetical protein